MKDVLRATVLVAAAIASLASSHAPQKPTLVDFSPRTEELPAEVTDDDALTAAVRTLAPTGLDLDDRWRRDGLMVTQWVEMQPMEITVGTSGGDAETKTVRRKHAFRVTTREGTITFSIDCIQLSPGELVWDPCSTEKRYKSFVEVVTAASGAILDEATRRASRRAARAPGKTHAEPGEQAVEKP